MSSKILPYSFTGLLLTIAFIGNAQLSSVDIRHASGKGPFPVYVNMQYSITSAVTELEDFSEIMSYIHPEVKKIYYMNGLDANAGFIINNDKIQGWSVEGGFRYLYANIKGNGNKVQVEDDLASVRIGKRFKVFYPVTVQAQIGTVFFHQTTMVAEAKKSKVETTEKLVVPGLFSGVEWRGRLMLFDPAGTSGGLGVILEHRYNYNFDKQPLDKFYSLINVKTQARSRWNYHTFSIGLVVPLALRIR